MFSQSQMPYFKQGDLVRSTAALPITHTLRTRHVSAIDEPNNIQLFSIKNVPVDHSAVQGLPIKSGVVFEVDAVLPWEAPEEQASKRYRLVLNPRHLEHLDEPDRRRSEAEFSSLQIILGEEDSAHPFFYTFADDQELELVTACDGRLPSDAVVETWTADDYFPWSVRVQFPTADEVLRYEIEARLYDGSDENGKAFGFGVSLRPLYVGDPQVALLSLQIKPSDGFDYDLPCVDFYSERKVLCQLDLAKKEINVIIQFHILIDLDQSACRYAEDKSPDAKPR